MLAPYVNRPLALRRRYDLPYNAAVGAAGAVAAYSAKNAYNSLSKYMSATKKKSVARRRKQPYQALNSNANTTRKPYKKSTRRKRYGKGKSKVNKLSQTVRNLKRSAEADQGMLTYRHRTTGSCLSSVNAITYDGQNILSSSFYEAVLAQLRYYNPSSPSTLVQADGATGTYMKDFYFEKVFAKLTVRNNYQVPCKVTVYSCKVKSDTSVSPVNAITNGLTDVGAPSATSPIVYPSDSPQFRDLWSVVATTKKVLQPGEEMVVGYSAKPFTYDPSLFDSQTETYQARVGAFTYLIRTEGVLGHDTSAAQYGTLQSGVDWQIDRTVKVKYSAGADIEYVYVVDASYTFTNGGVCSSKPVADNIPYSVA